MNLRIRQERHLAVYTVRSFRPIILSPISENGELPDFNLTPKEDEINEMLSLSTDLTSSDAFRGDPKTSNNRPTSIDTSLSASLSRKDDTSLLEDLTPKASEYVNNLNLKQNKNNNQIAGFLSVDSDSELDYSLELDYDNADMHSAHILLDIGDIGSKSVFAIIVLVPYLHFFVTPGLFTLLGYSIRIWFYFQYAALYTFVIKETLKA